MNLLKISTSLLVIVLLGLSAYGFAQTTSSDRSAGNAIACWDFSDQTAGTSLSNGARLPDSCNDHDGQVLLGLEAIPGAISGSGALRFSSTNADAVRFVPGFDFGDGGPVAGEEFDFAAGESFTVEAIVRIPASFTGVGSLIAKDVGPGQPSWWFRVSNGRLQALVSDGNEQLLNGNQTINNGQWTHVAMVNDADTNTLRVYINYQLDASRSIDPVGDIATPESTAVTLGAFNNDARQLQGDIQLARISGAALAPAEFQWFDIAVDLAASIDHDGQELTPGGTASFEIGFSNAGPSDAVDIDVELELPEWIASASWTCTATGNASCSASGSGDLIDLVSLPAGGSVVYTLDVDIALNTPGTATLIGSIDPGGLFDLDPSNNQATRAVAFIPPDAPTLPCWNLGDLTPGITLFADQRIADSCGGRDARVIEELPVIEGPIPGSSAVAFSRDSANALSFQPGFDFGDGSPLAGTEFDFAGDDSFTIEAIVRVPESFTSIGGIVAKDVGAGASWWLRIEQGQLRGLISDGDLTQGITGSRTINTGRWHHVAMVRDAETNTMRLYVDYRLDAIVNTQPVTDINTPEGTPITLGGFNVGTAQRRLQGDMHLARISRMALPPTEFELYDQAIDLIARIDYDNQPLDPGNPFSVEISFGNIGQTDAAGNAVAVEMPDWIDSASWTCTASAGASCSASGTGDVIDLVDLPAGQSVTYTLTATASDSMPNPGTLTATIDPGELFDIDLANNQAQQLFYASIPALACWDFAHLPAGTSLADGSRVEDSCQNRDARANGQLEVVGGITPGRSALAFSATTTHAVVFEPGYDFGDGGSVAGDEFDFAGGDSFTLEAIIQVPENFTGIGAILAKDVGPGQRSWWFRVQNGRLRGLISDGTNYLVEGNARVNTGTWHHVALIRDASTETLKLYVDYQLDASVSTGPVGNIFTPPNTNISVGAFNNGTQRLEGAVQSARVTRAALPPKLFLLNDQVANVSVSMSHDGQHPTAGGTKLYEITVTNTGPMNTQGITLEALMPDAFASAIWTCTPGTGATCTPWGTNEVMDIIDLPTGQSVVYTVIARLEETLPSLFTYTATITPGTFLDLDLTDNVASLTLGNTRLYVNAAAAGGDGSDWDNAFRHLQHALAAARELLPNIRSEIWVAGGVYYPHLGGPANVPRQNAFTLVNHVEIYGGFDGTESSLEERDWLSNPTVLSGNIGNDDVVNDIGVTERWEDIVGDNAYNVVRGAGLAHAVLDGFIITGGRADGSFVLAGGRANNGGGISLRNANVTLRHLRLQGNLAFAEGAAAGSAGGGIFHFTDNFSTLSLDDVTFKNNLAERGGGMDTSGGFLLGHNLSFLGNRALAEGGGLHTFGVDPFIRGSAEFRNSVFAGNQAVRGGAIYSWSPQTAVANSLITGNFASDQGGAIYQRDTDTTSGALVLTNVTISGNHAGDLGGAIYRNHAFPSGGGDTQLRNSIVWNNSDSSGTGTVTATHAGNNGTGQFLLASHSLLQGWDFADESNFSGTDPDNAPEFLSPTDPANAPTTAGNFRLPEENPFIDGGDNTARINRKPYGSITVPAIPIIGNILVDLDGNPRILDGDGSGIALIDLGPYESFGLAGFTVGGQVTGLAGSGLVLQINGGNDLAIIDNGSFTFPPLVDDSSYEVTVLNQPGSPPQNCAVEGGQGVISGADVTDVLVECVTLSDGLFHDRFQN
ncbi:MAG: hypothetical protein EA418_11265 [Wenzhouxiangellaceae bacterium]|nr:MAG: hypothetical protein EA418_11265 [Wenzhouxiangellaceae bacterium]